MALVGLAGLLVLAGCTGGGKPATAATSTSTTPPVGTSTTSGNTPRPVATQTAAIADGGQVQMDVIGLRRTAGGSMTLQLRFTNPGSSQFFSEHLFGGPSDLGLQNVYLLDLANMKEYLPGSDSASSCLCTDLPLFVKPQQTVDAYAIFAAPPESTSTLQLVVPHFQPVNVTLTR